MAENRKSGNNRLDTTDKGQAYFDGPFGINKGELPVVEQGWEGYVLTVGEDNRLSLTTGVSGSGGGTALGDRITTGSITASVNIGANTFRIQSGSSTFLYVSSSGNIGIGTTTPSSTLHISGTFRTELSNTIQARVLGVDSNGNVTIFDTSSIVAAGGGGNVIGTGIANYVPLWTNASTIATSSIYQSSSNIGIGTTTPSSQLHISNATSSILTLSSPSSSLILSSSGAGTGEARVIIGAGRAGNGESSLDLIANPTNQFSSRFVREAGIDGNVNIANKGTGSIYIGNLDSGTVSGKGQIVFYTNNDYSRLVIDSNGNVGIGTTAPLTRLHISGANSDSLLRIQSPASASIMFVSGSGNVGIGTGTPTNTLQVVGGITATSITASIISASSGITGSLFGTSSWAQSASNAINAQTASFLPVGTYQITSSWAVSASQALTASFLNGAFLQNGNSFGTTALLGTNDSQSLQFETSGSVRMTISSSGNVGIGTTTPQGPLHIRGTSLGGTTPAIFLDTNGTDPNEPVDIRLASGSARGIRIIASSSLSGTPGGAAIQFYNNDSLNFGGQFYIDSGTTGSSALIFRTNNTLAAVTERMRIAGDGTVSIKGAGTTSATTILSIVDSTLTPRFTILGDGTSAFNTNHLYISGNGNIGIGTTSPAALLDVSGNTIIRGALTASNVSASGNISSSTLHVTGNENIGGTSTITGRLTANSGITTTTITASGAISSSAGLLGTTVTATSNVTVGGTLSVTGATTLTGALTASIISASSNISSSTLRTTSDTAVGGTLNVTGATTLVGALTASNISASSNISSSTLRTTGNTAVGGTLNVTGATTLVGALTASIISASSWISGSDLHVANSATVGTTLRVTGATTLIGALTASNISASSWISGSDLRVANSASIGGTLGVTGVSTFADDLNSPTFFSGFAGSGWKLDSISSKYSFEVDDLTVRGTMKVYELLISQIRATNGSIFVSNTGKVETVTNLGNNTYYLTFDTGSQYGHSFKVGDIIRAQRFNITASTIYQCNLVVAGVPSTQALTASFNGTYGTSSYGIGIYGAGTASITAPTGGMEFVRLGSTVDTNRQGTVYLTADDNNAPFVDVKDGVTSHDGFNSANTTKVRMGKLDGITSPLFGQLSGYGLWASGSAYLEGTINATAGKIGGFTITNDAISGTGFFLSGSAIGNDFFISASNFNVKADGTITASNATLSGTITANTGAIGGWDITSTAITKSSVELNSSINFIRLGTAINLLTGSGIFLSGSGETLIGSASGHRISFIGGNLILSASNAVLKGNTVEISGSNFHLLNGSISASNATLSGTITANAGRIGGFGITQDAITGSGFFLSGSATGDGFFISASNFNVKANGQVTGSNVLFTGGKIGGFTLSSDAISGTGFFLSGSATGNDFFISASNFNVKANGTITASNATLSGTITANAGRIGGFAITQDAITGSGFFLSGSATGNDFFISASNFNVKANGTITASAGLIGGFNTTSDKIESTGSFTSGSFTSPYISLKATGEITGSEVLLRRLQSDGNVYTHFDTSTGIIDARNVGRVVISDPNEYRIYIDTTTTGSGATPETMSRAVKVTQAANTSYLGGEFTYGVPSTSLPNPLVTIPNNVILLDSSVIDNGGSAITALSPGNGWVTVNQHYVQLLQGENTFLLSFTMMGRINTAINSTYSSNNRYHDFRIVIATGSYEYVPTGGTNGNSTYNKFGGTQNLIISASTNSFYRAQAVGSNDTVRIIAPFFTGSVADTSTGYKSGVFPIPDTFQGKYVTLILQLRHWSEVNNYGNQTNGANFRRGWYGLETKIKGITLTATRQFTGRTSQGVIPLVTSSAPAFISSTG